MQYQYPVARGPESARLSAIHGDWFWDIVNTVCWKTRQGGGEYRGGHRSRSGRLSAEKKNRQCKAQKESGTSQCRTAQRCRAAREAKNERETGDVNTMEQFHVVRVVKCRNRRAGAQGDKAKARRSLRSWSGGIANFWCRELTGGWSGALDADETSLDSSTEPKRKKEAMAGVVFTTCLPRSLRSML